jgi:hypothetical protein
VRSALVCIYQNPPYFSELDGYLTQDSEFENTYAELKKTKAQQSLLDCQRKYLPAWFIAL